MILHKLKTNRFTLIDNELIADARLSWKAKGILLYLLSKPEQWIVRVGDIIKHGPEGESAVRAALRELRKTGYAKLEDIREGGHIIDRRLTISESGGLVDDFLNRENLNREFRHLNKTDEENKTEKEKKTFSVSVDFIDEALQKEWAAFQVHRKQIGHPLTLLAKRRIIEDLNKWRDIPARVLGLRNAIEAGWRKPFEPREQLKPKLPYRKREDRINALNERKAQVMRQPPSAARDRQLEQIRIELHKL